MIGFDLRKNLGVRFSKRIRLRCFCFRDGFRRLAAEAGATCQAYGVVGPLPVSWQAEHARLVQWVEGLPRPVGVPAAAVFDRSEIHANGVGYLTAQ